MFAAFMYRGVYYNHTNNSATVHWRSWIIKALQVRRLGGQLAVPGGMGRLGWPHPWLARSTVRWCPVLGVNVCMLSAVPGDV